MPEHLKTLSSDGWCVACAAPCAFHGPECGTVARAHSQQQLRKSVALAHKQSPAADLDLPLAAGIPNMSADAPAMAKARGLENVKPYVLELAPDAASGGGYPIPGQTITAVRNNHLQYAVTWFGLAATLVVIYVIYQVRRRD